jgi:predicted dehydrogenase
VRRFRWGILGTGAIARQFVKGLRSLPEAEVLAVGSRSEASATKFADGRGIPRRHASYADLASDPDVDVVYIATPHPFHAENATLCLEAGKAVLCEKPFSVNAAEAQRVVGLAREKGLFLMEGMWTRFFPLMEEVRRLVSGGALGEVRMLNVDFGFRADPDPASRLFAPVSAGEPCSTSGSTASLSPLWSWAGLQGRSGSLTSGRRASTSRLPSSWSTKAGGWPTSPSA